MWEFLTDCVIEFEKHEINFEPNFRIALVVVEFEKLIHYFIDYFFNLLLDLCILEAICLCKSSLVCDAFRAGDG